MDTCQLSINIVNYNNSQFLTNCIKSIYEYTRKINFTILVIDNASTDNSIELIKNKFLALKIIKNDNNIGFAKAHNIGIKLTEAKYILILNPDTLFIDASIERMVDFMDKHADTGIVGPKILNPDKSPQHTGITYPNNLNLLFETFFLDRIFPDSRLFGRHKKIYEFSKENADVDYMQGSCLMTKKEVIEDIGLLDERFFMYFEETDFCYRAKKKGWKISRLQNCSAIHFGCGETGYYDEPRIYQYHKSLILFYRKFYSATNILLLKIILFARALLRSFLWIFIGLFNYKKRKEAWSRVKGHLKVVGLLLGPAEKTTQA